jgi:hypothetical protein
LSFFTELSGTFYRDIASVSHMLPPMPRRRAPYALPIVIAVALAACSEGKPPPAPPRATETAFAMCMPDAGWEPCGCEDPGNHKNHKTAAVDGGVPPAAPKSAGLDPVLQSFLMKLGAACATKDLAFLEANVRFPLRWRDIVGVKVPGGPPITKLRRIASPAQLCAQKVFADIQGVDPAYPVDPAAAALGLTEHGSQCRVETLVGQFNAELVLEKSASGWTLVAVEAGD